MKLASLAFCITRTQLDSRR